MEEKQNHWVNVAILLKLTSMTSLPEILVMAGIALALLGNGLLTTAGALATRIIASNAEVTFKKTFTYGFLLRESEHGNFGMLI